MTLALTLTAIGATVLALIIVVVAWYRVDLMKRMRRYEAQWEIIREQSRSEDPLVRRAAAKQALRLIQRGPT